MEMSVLGQPDIDGGLCFPFQHSFSGKRHFGKDMQVVFTIDGRDLKYDFPAGTAWAASYRNIYSISLDGNGLIIGGGEDPSGGQSGVTIEPWTDSQNNDISLVPVI
jgi:hypothetical protein